MAEEIFAELLLGGPGGGVADADPIAVVSTSPCSSLSLSPLDHSLSYLLLNTLSLSLSQQKGRV